MLKQRIIFTLLYDNGYYIQSRNFRRQKIGNAKWINKNYNFSYISKFIDDLIILDVYKKKNKKKFINDSKLITDNVFVPIALGGGVYSFDQARYYFENGADKTIINSIVINDSTIINKIANNYGSSSVIISIDVRFKMNNYFVYINNGLKNTNLTLEEYLKKISNLDFAEIYLNSIDRDGTGTGIDKGLIKIINKFNYKYIITGGLGNYKHFIEGFKSTNKVKAIATANLLNFLGDSLKIVKANLLKNNINLVS